MTLSEIFTKYNILYTMHLIGLVFGLGGVTITDVVSAYGMHYKPAILPKAVSVFSLISFMVWVGLALLVISGIGLWLTSASIYDTKLSNPIFYGKLVLAGIVTLNGLFLNIVVSPAFEKAVALDNFLQTKEYKKATILGFISGGLSFACWWGATFLGIDIFRIME